MKNIKKREREIPSQVKVLEISVERYNRIVQSEFPTSEGPTYFDKSAESFLSFPPIVPLLIISGESRIPNSPLSARRLISLMEISLRKLSGEFVSDKFDIEESEEREEFETFEREPDLERVFGRRSGDIARMGEGEEELKEEEKEGVIEEEESEGRRVLKLSYEDFISGDFVNIDLDNNMPNNYYYSLIYNHFVINKNNYWQLSLFSASCPCLL